LGVKTRLRQHPRCYCQKLPSNNVDLWIGLMQNCERRSLPREYHFAVAHGKRPMTIENRVDGSFYRLKMKSRRMLVDKLSILV
jgi:hypothetical protein